MGRSELGVGWVWVGYQRLLLADLERKYRAFAVAIYLGRGRDFLAANGARNWGGRANAMADEKAGMAIPRQLPKGVRPFQAQAEKQIPLPRFAPIKYC